MNRTRALRRTRRVRTSSRRDLEALETRQLLATFTVNSTADILSPPAGTVTLRSAIQAASTTPGPNTIVIPTAGTYKITTAGTATDNSAGELAIADNGNLTIENTSGGVVTIDGGGINRVFDVNPGNSTTPFTVTFQNLTITDGVSALNASGGGIDAHGAASLVVTGCVLTGNVSGFGGGGVAMDAGTGSLTLTGSQVVRNVAENGGGGVAAYGSEKVTISSGSTVADNTAMGTEGGGGVVIFNNGSTSSSLTVSGSEIDGNRAIAGSGGGISDLSFTGNPAVTIAISGSLIQGNFAAGSGGGYADQGGSISVTATNSFVLDNAAVSGGGGIAAGGTLAQLVNTTLAGNTALNGGGADFRGSTALVNGSTISGNSASENGGGLLAEASVAEFDVIGSTIERNVAEAFGNGGGIDMTLGGSSNSSILDDLFLGNVTNGNGGALVGRAGFLFIGDSRFTANSAKNDGAMAIGGTFSISDSTIDGNRASSGDGGVSLGVVNGSMTNDTVEGNVSAGATGGIDTSASVGGTMLFRDDTVDGNSGGNDGGGIYQDSTVTVNILDTIVAGNTSAGSPSDYDFIANVGGTLNDKGGNLLGNATGDGGKFGPSTVIGDPKLGPLVDNGGNRAGAPSTSQVIPTQALLPGSPAILAGVASITDDERGFNRPTKPSIGAYEPQYASTAPANQVFVEDVYEVLFNRVADSTSLTAFTNFLNAGGSPTALVQALQGTAEFLGDEAKLVTQRYLGRTPSAADLTGLVAFLQSGHTPEQLAAIFVGSAEFSQDYGSNTDVFVQAAVQTVLGRVASPAEVAAWDYVLAGGVSHQAAATLFLSSQEYLTDVIDADFAAIVGRPPQPADLANFLKAAALGATTPFFEAVLLAASFGQRT